MRHLPMAHTQFLPLVVLMVGCPIASGQEVARFTHKSEVQAVAFSPNGGIVAVGFHGKKEARMKLWDVKTRKELAGFEARGPWVRVIAFSPDGKTLASGGVGGVQLWDVSTGKEISTLPNKQEVSDIAFSRDSKKLVTVDRNPLATKVPGHVKLWDLTTQKELGTAESEFGMDRVVWSADEKHLVTRDYDGGGNLKFRDPKTLKMKTMLAVGSWGAAISPDSKLLAYHDYPGKKMVVWNLTTERETLNWKHDQEATYGIAFSPNGKLLATVSGDAPKFVLDLWEVSSGKKLVTVQTGKADFLVDVPAFSAKGDLLAFGHHNEIIIWDLQRLLKSQP